VGKFLPNYEKKGPRSAGSGGVKLATNKTGYIIGE